MCVLAVHMIRDNDNLYDIGVYSFAARRVFNKLDDQLGRGFDLQAVTVLSWLHGDVERKPAVWLLQRHDTAIL